MKLFASDLDGTLLNEEFQISEANIHAIERLQTHGVVFAIATGRIHHDADTICQRHGLYPYIIASNGSCIFDKEGNQIYGRWILSAELEEIAAYLESMEVCYGIGSSNEYLTSTDWEKAFDREIERLSDRKIIIPDKKVAFAKYEVAAQNGYRELDIRKEIRKGQLTCYSISVVTYDEDKIHRVAEFVRRFEKLTTTVAGTHSLEIMSKDGTKGNAVKYLADLLKIKPNEVGVIGDSFNDLSMMEFAGTAVAMGNARDEIKKACTFTTINCKQDGFAHAVNILIGEL